MCVVCDVGVCESRVYNNGLYITPGQTRPVCVVCACVRAEYITMACMSRQVRQGLCVWCVVCGVGVCEGGIYNNGLYITPGQWACVCGVGVCGVGNIVVLL